MSSATRWLLAASGAFVLAGCGAAFLLARTLGTAIRGLTEPESPRSGLPVAEIEDARHALAEAHRQLTDAASRQDGMIDALEGQNARLEESEGMLKSLQQRLLDAQESDRVQLARELHDELGQELALMHLLLRTAAASSQGTALAQAQHMLDRLVERVRTITHDLRPPQLDDLGLAAALRALLRHTEQDSGLAVAVRMDNDIPRLGQPLETALFRVTQAAVTNALRHAQASTLTVSLHLRDDGVHLSVADDGRGFDPQAPRSGIGLAVMRERVAALGGSLKVESAPDAGTSVTVWAPRDRKENAE